MKVVLLICMTGWFTLASAVHASEVVRFQAGLEVVGKYTIDKSSVLENRDISTITCATGPHCLIASDEGVYVQQYIISQQDKTLKPGSHRYGANLGPGIIELLPPSVGSEIDIEAAAAIDNTFYITGSHGLAKNSGQWQAPRHNCFRFQIDPATGRKVGDVQQSSLQPLLRSDPTLSPYYGKVLQQRGVNIEGLAARGGRLFFGLRNPNLNGNAHVIEIAPDALFPRYENMPYVLHTVQLGPGLGIRSMTATQDGFLIVAGNAGSEPGKNDEPDTITNIKDFDPTRGFTLFFWDGGTAVQNIGEFPLKDEDHKVETLTVLAETDAWIDLLVLYEGPAGGDPTVFRIHKPGG